MKLYIDKENVESIVKQGKGSYMFYEYTRLIRRGIDVHYNFSKKEVTSNPLLQIWFSMTKGQGVYNQTEYSETASNIKPKRPLRCFDFGPKGNANVEAVFLLKDAKECKEVENHNCVFIESVGKEFSVFQKFINIEDPHQEQATEIGSWSKYLSKWCPNFPLTDIVLADPYYFARRDIYQRNSNNIIRALVSPVKDFPVNLVILTDFYNIDSDLKLDDEVGNLRDILIEATENEDCKVTIVAEDNQIHDRNVITNYIQVKGGSGFQLKNRTKDDVSVQILSRASYGNEQAVNNLLYIYQRDSVDKAIRGYSGFKCIGDKVSNFLEF